MEFSEQQKLVIRILSDAILPEDDYSPSATQIGVDLIFIDITRSWKEDAFMGTASALDAIYDLALSLFSKPIAELAPTELSLLLEILSSMEDFSAFWEPFRTLTSLIYYALPPAYLPLGLPGPNVDSGGLTVDGHPV